MKALLPSVAVATTAEANRCRERILEQVDLIDNTAERLREDLCAGDMGERRVDSCCERQDKALMVAESP